MKILKIETKIKYVKLELKHNGEEKYPKKAIKRNGEKACHVEKA